jgi:ferritin-like metal-binding protein YciE
MKKISTLEEAFIHGLSDIYSSEKQMSKSLPRLAKASTNEELAEGFQKHTEETLGQIERLDKIIEISGFKLQRMTCRAMEGLVEESKEVIDEIEKGPIRDVMLITGAQQAEHYEIASYGCLVEMAKKLELEEVAELLEETLEEEKAADEKLNQIAINRVNDEALELEEAA